MKNLKSINSILALATVLVIGCAKEKPYDEQYKAVELLGKNRFQTTETIQTENGETITKPVEYLYVPMTLGTPMEVTDADPFYQGQEKLVRLAWTREGLQVREIERDSRYTYNDLNEYPVMTIPGDYRAYRCKEDAYGECTNVEEENTELEWYDKDNFFPKFESITTEEVNELDIFTLNNGSCLTESSTRVIDWTVEEGVINVELEKTYQVSSSNFMCFIQSYFDGNLKINGFRTRHFYSLVRLDKLTTPGYQAVDYPIPDHDEFGFFKNEEANLNGNYDRERKEEVFLMNRWNPGTADDPETAEVNEYNPRVINYFLTPEYSRPQNDYILQATHEAVGTMNREMMNANVPLQINLIEQPDRKTAVSPGDLRYTSLVLIEDPLANGLLGYGPSVSNPYTGEIVKAHTNMYLGVLTSMTRWVYQAAVDLTEERYREANPVQPVQPGTFTVSPSALNNLPQSLAIAHFPELVEANLPSLPRPTPAPQDTDDGQDDPQEGDVADNGGQGDAGEAPAPTNEEGHAFHDHALLTNAALKGKLAVNPGHTNWNSDKRLSDLNSGPREIALKRKELANLSGVEVARLLEENKDLTEIEKMEIKERARLDRYSRNNALATEFFPIGGTSKVIYPALLAVAGVQTERGTLKPFDELTEAQQEQVKKIIVASSYKATLIHELGHNLGLRHNFMGSYDKDNFYTEAEAKNLGLEAAPAFSSIMDYSFSEFNQLKVFGKYDLAALRFGYARQVELENGTLAKVQGSINEFKETNPIKSYMFCTDENAGLGATCNRFDEGTNVLEIANYMIKRYKDYYKYRNFRDGRTQYNTNNFDYYILGRMREFGMIRDLFEEYELYKEFYGEGLMTQGCSPQDTQNYPGPCGDIKSRIDLVDVLGDFFVEVLVTPDKICAITMEDQPNMIVEYRKLADIYDGIKYSMDYVPTSCFDPAVLATLAQDNPATPANEKELIVGETGKFFNGFKDTDPNFKYVNDRYALGTWPDKIFALQSLFQRTWDKGNSDTNHGALIDIASVREKAMPVLNHLVQGTPLASTRPFSTQNGQTFTVPYAIGTDYKIDPLEWYRTETKLLLGLPLGEGARTTLVDAALKKTVSDIDYGTEYEDVDYVSNNLMTVRKVTGIMPDSFQAPQNVYYYDARRNLTYEASPDNPVAFKMIDAINSIEVMELAGRQAALVAIQARLNPQAPDSLPAPVKVFWQINSNDINAIIDIRMREEAGEIQPITVDFFAQFFGQNAPSVFLVYSQGADFMRQILQLKTQIANTPPDDASDEIKALWDVSIDVLIEFYQGTINFEVTEFYKTKLQNLPQRILEDNKI